MDKALYLKAKEIQDQILQAKAEIAQCKLPLILALASDYDKASLKEDIESRKKTIARLEKEFEAL